MPETYNFKKYFRAILIRLNIEKYLITKNEFNNLKFKKVNCMAKTSTNARSKKTPKFSSRKVNRCFRCGRKHGYMRDFDLCRICFRELASEGMIPGVKKSSW